MRSCSTAPIDSLKVDRSFVSQITESKESVAIVRAIIAMAGGLGMKIVAEGVETEEQLATLSHLGCKVVQGFLFSRPLPPEAVEQVLARRELPPQPATQSAAAEDVVQAPAAERPAAVLPRSSPTPSRTRQLPLTAGLSPDPAT
jgi:predicted signal transduction protein with EAL and GGDEF domain